MRKVSALKARKNLGELLEEVHYRGEEFVITRKEKPMAVLIPVDQYELFLKEREEEFSVLEEIRAANRDKTSKEVQRDVEAAIRSTRGLPRGRWGA